MEPLISRQSSPIVGFSGYPGYAGRPLQRTYSHSVAGGAGGHGTKISMATSKSTRQVANWVGSGFGVSFDHQSSGAAADALAIANEKIAMQHLNDRLASYLETVRSLEAANKSLEIKIRETIEKRGPLEGRDFGKYNAVIAELRSKIVDMIKGNAHLAIALDNARLASEDFRMKMEYELSMRQMVEADLAGLRKVLDDTNVVRLHLESDIESLKEELITLSKNHKTDVAELRDRITQASVNVDIDAPKGQDLAKIMEEMREKYERIALKNHEELKAWHDSQITEVQVQVTESSSALKEATSMSETRRTYQSMDIDLQSALSLKTALKATLRDVELRYNMEIEKYNTIILRLQNELTQIRTDIHNNTREYEILLNIKVKLEAEIIEYRRLLDGGTELRLEDAVDLKTVQTKVVTVTQTLVDGKVVAESKDVKSSEKVATS